MKPHFSKRDQLIVGAGVLLLVLLIVYAQFFFLTPLKSDLAIKQQELTSEQKLLDIISQKKADNTTASAEDTRELQKKVPVEPLQEQLILDLEKAENVSNSEIKSMSFSKDAEVATLDQANPQASDGAQNTSADPNAANESSGNQQSVLTAPTGLKKLTVQLSVESPTYEDLEKFIATLESLKRIVVVEAITYSGGQEITSLDQEDPPISYNLTISAYYLPELADLKAELPKIDAPAPAGKANPLSQFPSAAQTQP
ncbi:pilus assembly protein PilO [Neobacillus sp. NPDC058068]|uniref:pilus assembly protein PilO n=1 Tax=Neobacillus sp. NPDC058068 TaxID=3346325 RepID=UPI0036DC648B